MSPIEKHEVEKEGFTVHLHVHNCDIPIRGNLIASGDDAIDKICEDDVIERLEHNVWAWALVEVFVEYPNGSRTESSFLGGCNYKDAKDFMREGGYFDDMVLECLHRVSWKEETIEFPPYMQTHQSNLYQS